MSSSSTSSNTVAWLGYINVQLNRYMPLPLLVFGTIGLALNIIIFTRRSLYTNSCTHYLLGNTFANIVVLYWVVITRIFSDGYGDDPSLTSSAFCKVRYLLTYISRSLSTWFIVLACADRWASSMQVQRRFNSVVFARIVILITTFICTVSFIHILVYFGDQKSSTSVTCYALPGPYRIFSDLQYLIFYALGPALIMLAFGLATVRNLRRVRRQVLSSTAQPKTSSTARREGQLLVMLFVQVTFIIIFTLPFAIQKLYDTATLYMPKTALGTAQDTVAATVVRTLSYIPHALGFFVYTLSARIFRVELLRIFNSLYLLITGRHRVAPMTSMGGATYTRNVETVNLH